MAFSFYTVDAKYCSFLREADPCVPYTMERKELRPFVGIVFSIKAFRYYAPLTSPKPKHRSMKNQIDFMKIKEGEWGAINFNNMIPVHESCLHKVEMKIFPSDSAQEIAYKNLLSNQLSWCDSHRGLILKQAAKLYAVITDGRAWESLAARCCDFALAERRCLLYGVERLAPEM